MKDVYLANPENKTLQESPAKDWSLNQSKGVLDWRTKIETIRRIPEWLREKLLPWLIEGKTVFFFSDGENPCPSSYFGFDQSHAFYVVVVHYFFD